MSQLKDLDKSKEEFSIMENLYNAQDLDSLCAYTDSDIMNMMREELLVNRNLRWVSKMSPLINKQRVFFAVGAAHLCGEDGLLELLSKQGYVIEGIKL